MTDVLSAMTAIDIRQDLGLTAHASEYYTFDDVFQEWLNRNNLNQEDLSVISPSFKGLPCILPVPFIIIDPRAEASSVVKLRIIKTEWYGVALPNKPKKYLIHPIEGSLHKEDCLIIESISDYNTTSMDGVSLWAGSVYSDRVILGSRLFMLPYTQDVERLLGCYLQLQQINRIQVLDMREGV